MKALSYVFILLNFGAVFSFIPTPKEKCNLWDYDCLTTTVQHATDVVSAGLAPLHKVFLLPINITKDGLNITLDNFKVRLASNKSSVTMKKVVIDKDLKLLRLVYNIPYLYYNASYNATGELYGVPVYGKGDMFIKATDVEIDMTISYSEQNLSDSTTFGMDNFTYWFDVGDVLFQFSDLYDGDAEKSKDAHLYLQQNWKTISNEFGKYFLDRYLTETFYMINTLTFVNPVNKFVINY